SLGHNVIEGRSAQAASHHQKTQNTLPGLIALWCGYDLDKRLAHWIAYHDGTGQGAGKTNQYFAGKLGQPTIGGSRHSVLLVDDQGNAVQGRRDTARESHIAAHAQYDVGTYFCQQAMSLPA